MIKGLDQRVRVVELGKIKIGGKRPAKAGQDWRAPEKWDHFGITTLDRTPQGDLKLDEKLMAALAAEQKVPTEQLREIPIALLSDDIEDVFPTAYVAYRGKVCLGRSDGETITWYCDPKTGAPLAEPRTVPNADRFVETATYDQKGTKVRLFKPHGTLNCVIASANARWGGVYKLRTTSIITIEQIYSGLVQVQALTRGFLRNVPLRLVVRPLPVAPNGQPTTVYVVHIEMRGADLTEIQRHVIDASKAEIATGHMLRATRDEYQRLLRAPGELEDADEQEEIATEFHPEPPPPVSRRSGAVVEAPTPVVEDAPADDAPAHDAETGEVAGSAEEALLAEVAAAETLAAVTAIGQRPDVTPAVREAARVRFVELRNAARSAA